MWPKNFLLLLCLGHPIVQLLGPKNAEVRWKEMPNLFSWSNFFFFAHFIYLFFGHSYFMLCTCLDNKKYRQLKMHFWYNLQDNLPSCLLANNIIITFSSILFCLFHCPLSVTRGSFLISVLQLHVDTALGY